LSSSFFRQVHECTSFFPALQTRIDYKTTTILLDGRRVKLELWDTSGQGRFCTIFRSYSRGAQGILLVYDITNRWSFDGIDRWIKEIDEHAPGVPRILVGNRLHLAFKRQVPTEQARAYAEKNGMTFFEVSPLCNFNVIESFTELSRIVLMRHGMEKIWRPNRVFSLQDLCCRAAATRATASRGPSPSALPRARPRTAQGATARSPSGQAGHHPVQCALGGLVLGERFWPGAGPGAVCREGFGHTASREAWGHTAQAVVFRQTSSVGPERAVGVSGDQARDPAVRCGWEVPRRQLCLAPASRGCCL